MAASLSFSDRVALLHKKVNTDTQGELSVFECEGGYIDLDYKGHSLIGINAKGKTQKQLVNMISAIYHACTMFACAEIMEHTNKKE